MDLFDSIFAAKYAPLDTRNKELIYSARYRA